MKRSQFAIALLAALAAVSNSVSLACDRCQTNCKSCSAGSCDDSGLLDIVDRFAGRVQSTLRTSLPKVSIRCTSHRGSAKACDEPTCGCEMRHASPRGDCKNCGPSTHHPVEETWSPPPLPRVMTSPAPHSAPAQSLRHAHPQPMPQRQPSELEPIPLPDAAVDPFMDESANRVRRVPASAVRYQRPASRYGDRYDPQAAANVKTVRLSDPVAGPTDESMGDAFANVHSSRRSTGERSIIEQNTGSVITASSTSRLQPVRTQKAARLPARVPSTEDEAAYYANPLR